MKPLVKFRQGRWWVIDPVCRKEARTHAPCCFCTSVPYLHSAQRYAQLVAVQAKAGLS